MCYECSKLVVVGLALNAGGLYLAGQVVSAVVGGPAAAALVIGGVIVKSNAESIVTTAQSISNTICKTANAMGRTIWPAAPTEPISIGQDDYELVD